MSKQTKFKQTEIGMIPEDWEEKRLGDEIELCYGKGLTENKRISGKFPVFGSNGIVGFHNQFLVEGSGIIIGRKGSAGEIKFSKDNFWPIDTTYFVKLKKKGNIYFWYYFLLTLKLNKMNSHSAVPGLNREQVYEILKEIPEYDEQSAIAKILSSLDSKIELNQQMNKTLEAIGQAIFKRWFVDFEFPDEEGKPYKSSGGEMVFNKELGKEIPKGWEVKNYGDLLIFERGIEPGSKSYFDKPFENSIKFYRVGDMLDNSMCSTYIDISLANNVKSEREDILVSFDGTVGRVQTSVVGAYSTGIRKVNSKDNHFSKAFIYFLMKSKLIQETIIKFATGTTILHASESLKYMCETIPDQETSNKFSSVINPFFRKIILCKERIQTLSQIRDSLLPKLMSGKIRVPVKIIK